MKNVELFLSDESKYKQAEKEELDTLYKRFLETAKVSSLFKNDSWKIHEISVCEDAVTKIIEQIRRRKLYFHIYHDINDLNELKETALYCFWILKLQPFYWRKKCEENPNYELNAKIALHFFTQGLTLYADEKTKKDNKNIVLRANFTNSIIDNLYYSFRFRDWSKEALMDLAESLIFERPAVPDQQETANNRQIYRRGG